MTRMTPHNLKRAALRLASLGPADRRWILRRLPRGCREPLSSQMAGLLKLTRGDAGLLEEIAADLVKQDAERAIAAIPAPPAMDPMQVRLTSMLEGLPPNWVAAVLKAQPAAVRDTYIEGRPDGRREELREALTGLQGELPPRLAGAIRACVETGEAPAVGSHPTFAELLKTDPAETQGAAAQSGVQPRLDGAYGMSP